MTANTTTLIFIALSYLLGSLPFAIIVAKIFGLEDPRSYGSGNPGATNVLRSGNKLAAVLTLLGDAAKGWLAVWLASHFSGDPATIAGSGLAAFLGHVFPVLIGFKGGKGVATAAGVFLGFNLGLGLATIVVWLFLAIVTRYSSLAAICAAVSAPLLGWWLLSDGLQVIAVLAICIVVMWRHKPNIQKLLEGTESRINIGKTQAGKSNS